MKFDYTRPLYLQVANDIKQRLVYGQVKPGEKLPPIGDLAIQYQINPNTAQRIYKELEGEELCFSRRGLGTFATEDPDRIQRLHIQMVFDLANAYIQGMTALGFTPDNMVAELRQALGTE